MSKSTKRMHVQNKNSPTAP